MVLLLNGLQSICKYVFKSYIVNSSKLVFSLLVGLHVYCTVSKVKCVCFVKTTVDFYLQVPFCHLMFLFIGMLIFCTYYLF